LSGTARITSANVGRLFSANCCSVQPPATISQAPGRARPAASRSRRIASSIDGASIQLTSVA